MSYQALDSLMSRQVEPARPGSLPGWERVSTAARPLPTINREAITTIALIALIIPAGIAMLIVEAGEKLWTWVDGIAERLFRRPTGKVVDIYDGRQL